MKIAYHIWCTMEGNRLVLASLSIDACLLRPADR